MSIKQVYEKVAITTQRYFFLSKGKSIPSLGSNRKHYSNSTFINLKMAEPVHLGKKLQEILEGLEKFAPLKLAENWDNVGLLVDPMKDSPIKSILLTNDLTEEIVEEAINKTDSKLIITYHPNIFQGLKSVTSRTWKERLIIKCIQNNIAVFAPHTSWDAVQGGVNDWLARALPISTISVLKPSEIDLTVGAGRLTTLPHPMKISDAIIKIKEHIGIPHLRLALGVGKNEESTISTMALCAGSGSSVLKGAKADLYLTGEMLHHDILEATQNGIHVVLCNHSDSERGFLKEFKLKLQYEILSNNVAVHVSTVDRDPLKTV